MLARSGQITLKTFTPGKKELIAVRNFSTLGVPKPLIFLHLLKNVFILTALFLHVCVRGWIHMAHVEVRGYLSEISSPLLQEF